MPAHGTLFSLRTCHCADSIPPRSETQAGTAVGLPGAFAPSWQGALSSPCCSLLWLLRLVVFHLRGLPVQVVVQGHPTLPRVSVVSGVGLGMHPRLFPVWLLGQEQQHRVSFRGAGLGSTQTSRRGDGRASGLGFR